MLLHAWRISNNNRDTRRCVDFSLPLSPSPHETNEDDEHDSRRIMPPGYRPKKTDATVFSRLLRIHRSVPSTNSDNKEKKGAEKKIQSWYEDYVRLQDLYFPRIGYHFPNWHCKMNSAIIFRSGYGCDKLSFLSRSLLSRWVAPGILFDTSDTWDLRLLLARWKNLRHRASMFKLRHVKQGT